MATVTITFEDEEAGLGVTLNADPVIPSVASGVRRTQAQTLALEIMELLHDTIGGPVELNGELV